MKQLSCHIITLIFLVSAIGFYQDYTYAATNVEIHGQIGGNETDTQPSKEQELKPDTKLAQPKQNHIELKKFPNNGSEIDRLAPIGGIILLIYLLLNRWKAHHNKNLG